jgi:hypothetical protein
MSLIVKNGFRVESWGPKGLVNVVGSAFFPQKKRRSPFIAQCVRTLRREPQSRCVQSILVFTSPAML